MKRNDNQAWLFVIPAAAIMALVGVVPLMTVFNYSFFDIFSLKQLYWVGSDWYKDIVTSGRFYGSLARSLLFSTIILSVQIPLGIAIALNLPKSGNWRILILMMLALPLVVPWNIIPIMWLSLINPQTGYAGQALLWLGIGFDYKFNPFHTWIMLVAMDTWHWVGLVVVLAYAGLSGIPQAFYRAAAIDGASAYQIFRYIQLPKLGGVLSMAVLLRFVDSFMIYTEAFRINAGGPNSATMFLSLDLGEDIAAYNYGPAAARSMVYFLLILKIAWIFRTVMDSRKSQDEVAA